MTHIPGFTGSRLDRADRIRLDPAALAAARIDPHALFLPLSDLDPHLLDTALLWLRAEELPADAEALFLGLENGAPRFAVSLATGHLPTGPLAARSAIERVAPADAATFGGARSLMAWHAKHRHCPSCGTTTELQRGGWMRRCPGCGSEEYPRVDPVVIMLAEYDGQVLLGRQPQFPKGRFSALAGFVEVGESIEEAVARELFEEAGVAANDVRYITSQPWPFPSSLMIGCFARVENPDLVIDTTELESAMWVSRGDVVAAMAGEGPFGVAPPYALAYSLLRRWVDEAL